MYTSQGSRNINKAKPRAPPRHDESSHCRALFTVPKEGSSNQLLGSEESYAHLSHQLPTLLREEKDESASSFSSPSSSFVAYPGTRLHLMRGSVPYIPCQVQEYGVEEVGRCVAVRAAKGASTWITFVGDSNGRQKVHSFLGFLPADLTYSYYLENEQVNLYEFIQAVTYHKKRPQTFDIIGRRHDLHRNHHQSPATFTTATTTTTITHDDLFSVMINSNTNSNTSHILSSVFFSNTFHQHPKKNSADENFNKASKPLLESDLAGVTYDLRVTLVWAPCGTTMGHPTVRAGRKVTKLHDLVLAKVVPDVVIMGFGTWPLLMREYDDEIVPFSEMDVLFRPLIQTVTALAARTRVIFWRQSRYRGFNYDRDAQPSALPWDEDPQGCWANFLYYNQFEDAIPLVDGWLWEILRRTGAWLWDSAVPFNLANLRECQTLRGAGYFNHTVYQSRWWNCFDVHHAAYETNSIEMQMLLNLLCNTHLDTPAHYCCST
ncbi:uncharacterized protein LOC135114983 isoform X2 [Scylla paramamosain]|uniref:uncharacterized protein LOC135114983 isoform X2 n=1 Tax=Scylla paramamosain TaxID=85552 RepID=UPI003083735D